MDEADVDARLVKGQRNSDRDRVERLRRPGAHTRGRSPLEECIQDRGLHRQIARYRPAEIVVGAESALRPGMDRHAPELRVEGSVALKAEALIEAARARRDRQDAP